jgi:carbonic anhydrase
MVRGSEDVDVLHDKRAFNVSRALFIRGLGFAAVIGSIGPGRDAASAATSSVAQPSADEAWRRLAAGNKRFATDKGINCGDNFDRRLELASGQRPYAIVLACADSRVAPELVFDQRVGDIFVVRVAGNIADDASIGSIEYAVDHFGSRLLVVMGHEKCGAVEAAVAAVTDKLHVSGHVAAVVAQIEPAARSVLDEPGDILDNAVRAHVRRVVGELRAAAPVLAPAVAAGRLRGVGVRYALGDGYVSTISA